MPERETKEDRGGAENTRHKETTGGLQPRRDIVKKKTHRTKEGEGLERAKKGSVTVLGEMG